MPDNGDDSVTVVTGYFTLGADDTDIDAIRDALQDGGYAVDIDQSDGSITVQHAPGRSERSDIAADDTEQNLTKREQRIQRLQDGVEAGEAYTSNELAAIAYDKDVADVTLGDRAYISDLRSSGDIDLNDMSDPHRGGNAKLYYRGEQPDVAVSAEPDDPELPEPEPDPDEPVPAGTATGGDEDEDDEDSEDAFTCAACGQQFDTFHGLRDHHCETGDFPCPECDKAFDDDEALQNHLRDKHPGFYGDAPVTHAGTDEDADEGDDEEELLEEMGPCNIGKIAVKGTFQRYECQCGKTFEEEQAAMDHSDDTGHTLGWTAYDQLPKDHKKSLAKVSGPSTMR